MPVLVLNLPNARPRGLIFADRAVIGRRPFNTLMVPDPAVSRIHAWIGRRDQGFVLFDAGSRSGITLNGRRVTEPTVLGEGDEIGVGLGTITFHNTDRLPAGIAAIEQPPPQPAADPYDGGIYFDCSCGGPMWVLAEHAGAAGKCRYCGQRLVVPHRSGQTARHLAPEGAPPPRQAPAPPPRRQPPPPPQAVTGRPASQATRASPARASRPQIESAAATAVAEREPESQPQPELERCSICQSFIHPRDRSTICPSCNLTFHAQCWVENFGCSAYGCDQVNILAPKKPVSEQALMAGEPRDAEQLNAAASEFPWDSVLLALSFVAMAVGAVAYGVPSIFMLLAVGTLLLIGRSRNRGFALASIFVSLVGIVAGYAMSMFWWENKRVWERFMNP